jgi:hypothetical protein
MISGIPGWVNFFILGALYFILFLCAKKFTGFESDPRLLGILALLMSAGYLSKFREVQGGGWAFNGIKGRWGFVAAGAVFLGLVAYAILG